MNQVIDYALSHNPDHLFLLDPGCQCLSHPLVTSKRFYLSEPFGVTALTTLHLEHCYFSDGSERTGCFDISAICPNLINLCLIHCAFGMFEVLKISGPQLVNLTLEFVCGNKLEISAPKLTFFKFIPYYSHLSVTHLPSLEHANVDIYRPYAYPRKIEVCYPNFFKLMQGFHNAQFITLNSEIIEARLDIRCNYLLIHLFALLNSLINLDVSYCSRSCSTIRMCLSINLLPLVDWSLWSWKRIMKMNPWWCLQKWWLTFSVALLLHSCVDGVPKVY